MTDISVKEMFQELKKQLDEFSKGYQMTKSNHDKLTAIKKALNEFWTGGDAVIAGKIKVALLSVFTHLKTMEDWREDHGGQWLEE